MLRFIAERLSRGMVLRRRLPPEFGRGELFVSPDAGLRFYRRNLAKGDAILFKMVSELVKPGDVVWDVGANVGLFSFASANRATCSGQIVSIEADAWLAGLLQRSCVLAARRGDAPVTVIPAAVSDSVGIAKLHIAQRARSSNYLEGAGGTQAGGSRGTASVVSVTLDWLLERLPAPSVLKIDVEGMEHRVLAGASSVLAKARPVIWCEVDPVDKEEVSRVLREHRYDLFYANQHPAQRQPLASAPWETLARPQPLGPEADLHAGQPSAA